jgi:hypothetical protein
VVQKYNQQRVKVTYNNVVHFLCSVAEIRPASIGLDDGEIVGHMILDFEKSRQLAGTGDARHAPHMSTAQPSNAHRFLPPPLLLSSCLSASCLFFTPRSHVRWI